MFYNLCKCLLVLSANIKRCQQVLNVVLDGFTLTTLSPQAISVPKHVT